MISDDWRKPGHLFDSVTFRARAATRFVIDPLRIDHVLPVWRCVALCVLRCPPTQRIEPDLCSRSGGTLDRSIEDQLRFPSRMVRCLDVGGNRADLPSGTTGFVSGSGFQATVCELTLCERGGPFGGDLRV